MKPRNLTLVLLLLAVAAIGFLFRRWREPSAKEAFDRHPAHLVYTRHARCRMDCRQISEQDIREVMDRGIINLNKSDRNDRPCPTYAIQGETRDGESIRVIFAQCDAETRVVTCYKLRQDFECHCPGDERKNHR